MRLDMSTKIHAELLRCFKHQLTVSASYCGINDHSRGLHVLDLLANEL